MPYATAITGTFHGRRTRFLYRGGPPVFRLAPLLIVFYSFLLLPPEVSITLGGINLPSYRLALLAMALPAFNMLLRSRNNAWTAIDLAVIFVAFWILLSFSMVYGLNVGFVRGAGIVVDTALPYLIARASVRNLDDLRYFLLLVLPGLLFSAMVFALESISGNLLVRPAFAALFGNVSAYSAGEASGSIALTNEYRLGLRRAYAAFSHPILGGVVMASFMPLFYFSGLRSWPFYAGLAIAIAGLFSLSSAAFLALMIALLAIGIYHIKPFFPKVSWWLIVAMLLLLIWTLHMASQSGIIAVIARLTLSPHTASYRTLIWEYGLMNVARHPWFGIGYQDWERLAWMGESIDAHFLMLAMRHGVFVPVALVAAILYGMVRIGRLCGPMPEQDKKLLIGLNVTMIIFMISGQTVAFFGSTNLVFMTIAAWLASISVWATTRANGRPVIQTSLPAAKGMPVPATLTDPRPAT